MAAYLGELALAKRLLEFGADPKERDPRGATPQMVALDCGHEELARLLASANTF
jgi:ankyrin repeat protein